MNRHLSGAEGYLRSALTVADRLATENARLREALASLEQEIIGPDDARWMSVFGLELTFKGKVGDYARATRARARGEFRRILAEVRDGR